MKVFISYKRNVEPDEPLALRLCEALREHYDVFIDQMIPVGTDWAERIQAELETCEGAICAKMHKVVVPRGEIY